MEFNLEEALAYYEKEQNITAAVRKHCKDLGIPYEEKYRHRVSRFLNSEKPVVDEDLEVTTKTETNQYLNDKLKEEETNFSAIREDGKMMNIEEFSEHYGLDLEKIRSFKLVTHTGTPYYNIAFHESVLESQVSLEEMKEEISKALKHEKYDRHDNASFLTASGVGVVKIADLHVGSLVENLLRTKDFSVKILREKLRSAAEKINSRNYKEVIVHILGDIIESFTGLSHKNTWKGLDQALVGAEAVKLACKILHEDFLSLITNLGEVKIVAGNHDRVTSDNKEDVQGDAANLIGWGLELIGYDVEFHPLVITHKVEGICHILTHGHHTISKKTTQQLCWDYGEQGMFNLICEGHLHSIIDKLSVAQRGKFQITKDDAVDHRRMNVPSFFTGNFYSEALGYTSQSGFVITEDNGNGVPNVFYYAV